MNKGAIPDKAFAIKYKLGKGTPVQESARIDAMVKMAHLEAVNIIASGKEWGKTNDFTRGGWIYG